MMILNNLALNLKTLINVDSELLNFYYFDKTEIFFGYIEYIHISRIYQIKKYIKLTYLK